MKTPEDLAREYVTVNGPQAYLAGFAAGREGLQPFLKLAQEVAYSGISTDHEHPAIDWIEVQVDKEEWMEFCQQIGELMGTLWTQEQVDKVKAEAKDIAAAIRGETPATKETTE